MNVDEEAEAEGIGDRIAKRLRATGVSNRMLAHIAGVSEQTVSAWKNNKQRPSEQNLEVIAPALQTTVSYLRYGHPASHGRQQRDKSKGSMDTQVENTLSQPLRIWLQEFLLEVAKAGATEHEIESARKALTSPEMFEFYHGGRRGSQLSEDELLTEMQAVATGIRKVLRIRGRNISAV